MSGVDMGIPRINCNPVDQMESFTLLNMDPLRELKNAVSRSPIVHILLEFWRNMNKEMYVHMICIMQDQFPYNNVFKRRTSFPS